MVRRCSLGLAVLVLVACSPATEGEAPPATRSHEPSLPPVRTAVIASGRDHGRPWRLVLTRGPDGDSIDIGPDARTGGTGTFTFDPTVGLTKHGFWATSGPLTQPARRSVSLIFGAVPTSVTHVGYDVARTGFVPGKVIDAGTDGLSAPYGVFLVEVPVVRERSTDGNLLAFDGSGRVFHPYQPYPGAPDPGSRRAATRDLSHALSLGDAFATYHGDSYATFDAAKARHMDPSLSFIASPRAHVRDIAVRASDLGIVLVTRTRSGAIYCIAREVGRGSASYGRVDTSLPGACSGGW